MSLIHTTELCGGNTFEYLVDDAPADWLPWTYQATLRGAPAPPAR